MTIEEIIALEIEKQIKELKSSRMYVMPDMKSIEKSLNVKNHDVFDKAIRPDKLVKLDDDRTTSEPVARIGLALQKLIVKRAVSFIFGNPVELINKSKSETAFEAIKNVYKSAKINSFNRKIARDLFSCTEVAELWYPVPVTDPKSEEKFKLRVKKLSPLTGDKLYPYFDEYGDLIAFSREFGLDEEKYFEVYTNTAIIKYNITKEPVLVDGFPTANEIGKIPIVFAKQDETAYEDVNDLISRLEKIMSNFADTNDYHSAPKIFVKGTIKGFSKKGESGAILEGDSSTDVKYLSWNNAPESVKLEIQTLKEMIYTLSQTPDISFDSIKGLGGNVASGKALRFMFLDAHLKVMDNMEVFEEYLERRNSVVKAFLEKFNTGLKTELDTLEMENEVVPFMVDDYADKLEFIMTATGNKSVLSQKTGVKMSGLVDDVEEEYKNIQSEERVSLFEPTNLE